MRLGTAIALTLAQEATIPLGKWVCFMNELGGFKVRVHSEKPQWLRGSKTLFVVVKAR